MTTNALVRTIAIGTLMAAFVVSVIPAIVLASDGVPPGAVEVGAPSTYNPTPDPSISVGGAAALGTLDMAPAVWALVLVIILGAVAWGVYRYSADTVV